MSTAPALERLRLGIDGAIARVTIDNGPLNLMDGPLVDELDRLGQWLMEETALKVVIFQSANPHFFIAHADLNMLAETVFPDAADVRGPSMHQLIVDRFRLLPQVTIGKIAGIARGGGSEFLLALDMRFGAIDRAVLGQLEVPLGFPPGCGATQRLPRLVGRAKAIEVILGAGDFTAVEAERMGWINRALPADELDAFVDELANRIASYPAAAIVEAKTAIDAAELPLEQGFARELACFLRASDTAESRRRVTLALDRGLQTVSREVGRLEDWLVGLADETA